MSRRHSRCHCTAATRSSGLDLGIARRDLQGIGQRQRDDGTRSGATGCGARTSARIVFATGGRFVDRPGRHHQKRRGVAALRCRHSLGTGQSLPGLRQSRRFGHLSRVAAAFAGIGRAGLGAGRSGRMQTPGNTPPRGQIFRPCLRDLHLRFHRPAKGHRHQPSQHLPFSPGRK